MGARDFFRLVLGLLFICIGIWGNAFSLLPWPLWGKVDESSARPIARSLGATIFIAAGIGLVYLALRPIIFGP
jgi:hypothetical protein